MKRRKVLSLSLSMAALGGLPRRAKAALVPPVFLDCVVAIGYPTPPSIQNGIPVPRTWHTTGTGFFYGHLVKNDPDVTKRLYSTYLVTAGHVVGGYAKMQAANLQIGNMKIRVNSISANSAGTEFDLLSEIADPGTSWVSHPMGKDVAVIPVNLNLLRDKKFEVAFFSSDVHVAGRDKLKSLGTSAGDGVFVLGFPMDMAGAQKNYVIVRHGVIARISEMLDNSSDSYLIDSFVFPGNSGGPVVLEPEVVSITGTQAQSNAYLVGLVVEVIDYIDTAVSAQTGHARITFEENAGLGKVLPIDYIEDAILAAQSRAVLLQAPPPPPPQPAEPPKK
jgi:S1-C subfamily serine protease